MFRHWCYRTVVILLLLLAAIPLPGAGRAAAEPLDFDLPDGSGHFYRQANGQGGQGETGYAIANADGVRLWDEYQRLGGPEALGYPASRRFTWDGFTVQVMQKVVLQWRPEVGQAYFVNVFDRMHDLGKDSWLQTVRATPPPFDTAADAGLSWDQVVERHLAMLESNSAIKEAYWADSDPIPHFGLPMSYQDYGNVFVVRAQRAVFQQWKQDVAWARAGQVVIANGGDLAKEAGILPGTALAPELPPQATQPPAPVCDQLPIRGFGAIWSQYPEVYTLLGCTIYPHQEQGADVALQRFEHGWMLWFNAPQPGPPRGPFLMPRIYVLFDDNQTYANFYDDWSPAADPVSGNLTPPPGRYEPQRGFGKVWREGTGARVRERLGWAVEPEHAGRGAWQQFERGRLVWTPDPRQVILLAEHASNWEPLYAWRAYRDTYTP